jgi:hypothetical protein
LGKSQNYPISKFLENNIKNFGFYLIKVQCLHCEDQMVNALFLGGREGGVGIDWQHSNKKHINALCDSRILEF